MNLKILRIIFLVYSASSYWKGCTAWFTKPIVQLCMHKIIDYGSWLKDDSAGVFSIPFYPINHEFMRAPNDL